MLTITQLLSQWTTSLLERLVTLNINIFKNENQIDKKLEVSGPSGPQILVGSSLGPSGRLFGLFGAQTMWPCVPTLKICGATPAMGGLLKKTVFFGNFSQNGGGGHPISQNFCTITKSFLACQIHPKMLKHVFHTEGSNIWSILSIKVHLILSLSSSLREKNGLFWEFCPWGGGGPLFPKVNVRIVTKY